MEGKWNIELSTERTQLTEDAAVHVHFNAEVTCSNGHKHGARVIVHEDTLNDYYTVTRQLRDAIGALTARLYSCETGRVIDE